MTTSYFSYSKEEGEKIIVTDTLLSQDYRPQHADFKKLCYELKRHSEKELRLHLHMVTLSDYWRENMIPRGLRIKKFPSFGHGDIEFRQKWEAILNKCSQDLMLLLIEEAKEQKAEMQKQIAKIKQEITSDGHESLFQFEEKLKEDLEQLSKKLKQDKLAKFGRDENDYKEHKVYTWSQWNAKTPRKRSVSFNIPSSDEDRSAVRTSPRRDFLENKSRTNQSFRRQDSGRRDEEERDRPRFPIQGRYTRSRTREMK